MSNAPIYLTLNDRPVAILNGMNDLRTRSQAVTEAYKQRRWLPGLLFLAGLPWPLLDLLLLLFGYSVLVFSCITPVFWLAALVAWIYLRRQRTQDFSQRFALVEQVVDTLRDDLDPKRNFFGHLDLTGSRQTGKVAREQQDALGRITRLYRDEWLSLKTRLYDGNNLRLSAVQREKVRASYFKRSAISGKMKSKPERFKGSQEELKLRISLNPDVYDASQTRQLAPGTRISGYRIESFTVVDGIVTLGAVAMTEVTAQDVLAVLHLAYQQLQRKASA